MCPYIDRNDPRCADKLTLARIKEALEECGGDYGRCPIYQRIATEQRRESAA